MLQPWRVGIVALLVPYLATGHAPEPALPLSTNEVWPFTDGIRSHESTPPNQHPPCDMIASFLL